MSVLPYRESTRIKCNRTRAIGHCRYQVLRHLFSLPLRFGSLQTLSISALRLTIFIAYQTKIPGFMSITEHFSWLWNTHGLYLSVRNIIIGISRVENYPVNCYIICYKNWVKCHVKCRNFSNLFWWKLATTFHGMFLPYISTVAIYFHHISSLLAHQFHMRKMNPIFPYTYFPHTLLQPLFLSVCCPNPTSLISDRQSPLDTARVASCATVKWHMPSWPADMASPPHVYNKDVIPLRLSEAADTTMTVRD